MPYFPRGSGGGGATPGLPAVIAVDPDATGIQGVQFAVGAQGLAVGQFSFAHDGEAWAANSDIFLDGFLVASGGASFLSGGVTVSAEGTINAVNFSGGGGGLTGLLDVADGAYVVSTGNVQNGTIFVSQGRIVEIVQAI